MVSYVDRILVLDYDDSILAEFTLVVYFMTFIAAGVDYFYIAKNRKEFLRNEIIFSRCLINRKFLIILTLSIIFSISITLINFLYIGSLQKIPVMICIIVLISQIVLSLTNILKEIVYWSSKINKGLISEIIYWMLVITLFTYINFNNITLENIIFTSSLIIILRLILFLKIERNVHRVQNI